MKDCKIYAVIGNPILHSRSPLLFFGAFGQALLPAYYTRLASRSVDEALALAKELGVAGFNVTAPFKEEVAARADRLDDVAARLGAVNTVVVRRGQLEGANTDPQGLLGALQAGGCRPGGKRAVVLGAGGAAKAAAYALKENGAAHVTVINRTPAKAEEVAAKFGCAAATYADLQEEIAKADLLVSCLPAYVNPVHPAWLEEGLVVLDANYAASPLSAAAQSRGCRVISGLGWLLHQAAAAYRIFTQRPAPAADMEAALSKLTPPRQRADRAIALIGFMGSGKSEVGRLLAARLERSFVDLDRKIEERAKTSVAEIFAAKGETYFRRLEDAVLAERPLNGAEIVACGGGVVLSAANRRRLRQNAMVVWLSAPLDVCLSRAAEDPRPLLAGPDVRHRAAEMLARRLPLYAETADLVIDAGAQPPAAVAEKIADEIREA